MSFALSVLALLATSPAATPPARDLRRDGTRVDAFIRGGWDRDVSKADALPVPFVSCFPRLNFLFYWDTYFINQGLLRHDRPALARNNAIDLLAVVDKAGYVGNASVTTWGMGRSQPPYLSMIVRASYEAPPSDDAEENRRFLTKAYATLKREYGFWTDQPAPGQPVVERHDTAISGLQRFGEHETEASLLGMYDELVKRLGLPKDAPKADKLAVARERACEAATGMDFTPRFGGRCLEHAAVELNTNLWVYERNFAWMVGELGLRGEPDWEALADARRALVERYLWDDARGLYADYDFANQRPAPVAAATAFQPLWAGLASPEHARRTIASLSRFETPFGIATVERVGAGPAYQWGDTSLWPPMQEIVVRALDRYGARTEARRVAGEWAYVVMKNFVAPTSAAPDRAKPRPTGRTFEKYDSRGGTINDDEYPANVMIGWTGGVFASLYGYLTSGWRPRAGLPDAAGPPPR